jgi:hypothetical protein
VTDRRLSNAEYEIHEPAPEPTGMRPVTMKIRCLCGFDASSWMEFYRHRGDAYRDQLCPPPNDGKAP